MLDALIEAVLQYAVLEHVKEVQACSPITGGL